MSRNLIVKESQQKTAAETQGTFITIPNLKNLYPPLTQKRLQQPATPSPKHLTARSKPFSSFVPSKSEFDQERINGDALLNKLHIQPEDALHYYQHLPIKPGCDFYPSLLQYRGKLKQLHLNIPITVFSEGQKNYIAKTNMKGGVEISEDVTIEEDYYQEITQYVNFSNVDKDSTPAVFSMSTLHSDPCATKMEVWSYTTLEKKSLRHLQQDNILQQYLQGKSQCNCFVRLVYYPKRQLSEGHMVDNILAMFDDAKPIDRKLQSYFKPFPSDDIKHYVRRGSSLADYENEAKKIYTFLLYDIGLRVDKLVIDVMRGADNRLWFLNLKSYELEANLYKIKEINGTMGKEKITEEKRARKDEAENTVICKMCGLRYKVPELNKSLTLKMVYNVKDHLGKRGIDVYKNLKGEAPENMAHTMKTCSLCYSLAIAEYDLIDTECKLAQIQGIPATVDTILNRHGENANPIMDRSLYQWRVMIYLEYFFDIPPAFLKERTDYRIQYKIFDYTISFPLCFGKGKSPPLRPRLPSSPTNYRSLTIASNPRSARGMSSEIAETKSYYEKQRLDINKLRTSYFFSPTCNLDEFLKSEILSVRITEGDDWEKFVASGSSNIFADCTSCNYVSMCVKYTKVIMLFRRGNMDQIVKLKMNAGIKKGDDMVTPMMPMSPYGSYSIYFPPESYLTSEQFPCEWMELFDKYGGMRSGSEKELRYTTSIGEKDIKFYRPKHKKSTPRTSSFQTHFTSRTPARTFVNSTGVQGDRFMAAATMADSSQPKTVTVKVVEVISDISDTQPQEQTVSELKRPQTSCLMQRAPRNFDSVTERLKLESKEALEDIRRQISGTDYGVKKVGKKKSRASHKNDNNDLRLPATTTNSRRKLIKMFQSMKTTESFKNPYGMTSQPPSIWQAGTVELKQKKVKRTKLGRSKDTKKSAHLLNTMDNRTSEGESKKPFDLHNTIEI